MSPPGKPGGDEIFLEFVVQGSFVKATAIDPKSGIEASVMGPSAGPRLALADAARRKLNYLLKKQRDGN